MVGAVAAASTVSSGLLSVGLAALARPGEMIVGKASRLEDGLRELLRAHVGGGRAVEQGAGGQETKERFLRAYERLKSELLNDRAFNFDFTEETRRWVAEMLDYNVPGDFPANENDQ